MTSSEQFWDNFKKWSYLFIYFFLTSISAKSSCIILENFSHNPFLSSSSPKFDCLCVCVCSLLRYRLTFFLPPLPEVGCPIFLEIRNPWGKVMERSGLRYEHFCLKIVQNRHAKKKFFLHFFTFEVLVNGLFAPISQSQMSNIFRDSESLRKSNGKKWSNIWTF